MSYGRQRILFYDEQVFFLDGTADDKKETAKKGPCQKGRTYLCKSGTSTGQGRCGDAYGKTISLMSFQHQNLLLQVKL